MSASFPGALDAFTNPSGSALQGSPTPRKHSELHGDINDAVEAIEGVIGTTASPGLARLGGVAGGQTLTGGTAASETLTLASTAHATKGKINLGAASAYDELSARLGVGTVAPSAKLHALATTEQLRLGYDVANYFATTVGSTGEATLAATGGTIIIQGTTATDGPTLGSELLVSAGWTVPGGWTESPDDVFTHASGGGTSALSHSATIANATKYQLSWTITGRTAGSVTIAFGGTSTSSQTATGSYGPTTTSTAGLTITPTTDFDGAISLTSLRAVSTVSKPLFQTRTSGASNSIEARAVGVTNLGVGGSSLRYCTTGLNLSGFGSSALQNVTTGYSNSAFGYSTLPNLTVGFLNSCFGAFSGQSLTLGFQNTLIGASAGYNLTSSSSNVIVGAYAGRYQADGATALAATTNSVYIGYNSKGLNDSDSYSIVIGSNAVGLGATTTVLGTINQTTAATIYGAGTHSLTNATTNAAVTVETLTKNVTGAGVGAAGLGPRLVFAAESSTTVDTTQADVTATWTDATHASRKTRLTLSAWDSAAAREGVRIEADGSVARIGFFGATAVVKPTALTATVAAAPAGGTGTAAGGWDTAGNRDLAIATINNLKTRVDQLESKLQALGLLT